MSELWNVKVEIRRDTTVVLRIKQVHPDTGAFPRGAGFALRLLCDKAHAPDDASGRAPTGPLGEAVTFDNRLDEEFITENVDTYVAALDLKVVAPALNQDQLTERLIDEGFEFESDEFWDAYDAVYSEGRAGQATYTIMVTEGRWLDHLQPGQTWESAAY